MLLEHVGHISQSIRSMSQELSGSDSASDGRSLNEQALRTIINEDVESRMAKTNQILEELKGMITLLMEKR